MAWHAVIFDVDGVLVDSYQAHLDSWQSLAAQTGVRFSEQQFAASFGQTSRDIIARHWREIDLNPQQVAELDRRKESLYRQIITADFPAMEGAAELVESLYAAGFLLAAGSSGPAENIDLALNRLGMRPRFSAIVTGMDVARGKPDPQVFVLAAQWLDIPPKRCAVIEDAPAGIAAAHAAGMAAMALLSRGRARPDFAPHPPDMFIDSLRELSPARLQQIIDEKAQSRAR